MGGADEEAKEGDSLSSVDFLGLGAVLPWATGAAPPSDAAPGFNRVARRGVTRGAAFAAAGAVDDLLRRVGMMDLTKSNGWQCIYVRGLPHACAHAMFTPALAPTLNVASGACSSCRGSPER